MVRKLTRKVLIATLIAGLVVGGLIFLVARDDNDDRQNHYVCLHNNGAQSGKGRFARCVVGFGPDKDTTDCARFYKLIKAYHPERGIEIPTSKPGGSCEGIGTIKEYFYDSQGRFTQLKEYKKVEYLGQH